MVGLSASELLLYIGIAVMAASAASAVIACVLLRTSKKRLKMRLDAEFGKKRHG